MEDKYRVIAMIRGERHYVIPDIMKGKFKFSHEADGILGPTVSAHVAVLTCELVRTRYSVQELRMVPA